MLREKDRLLKYGLRIADLLLVVGAFYIAYYLHAGIITPVFAFLFTGLYPIEIYYWILEFTVPLCFIFLHFGGFYKDFGVDPRKRLLRKILKTGLTLTLTEYAVIYIFLRMFYVSRFFVFLLMALYFAMLAAFRLFVLFYLPRAKGRGLNAHQALIVGTGRQAREVQQEIESHPLWNLKLLGFITSGRGNHEIPAHLVIGEIKDLEPLLKRKVVDEVFVALAGDEAEDREEIFRICEKIGVDTYLVPAYYEWQLARSTTTTFGKLNLIRFFTVPINPYLLGIKRVIDLVVSSLVLIPFPFLYLFIGFLIKLDSPGPVLYRQIRVSHNKRQFYCYKFRTMLRDADARIDLLDAVNETQGPIRKARNDPRITRVGRVLRRFSIDEIPQFINIFKEEMSLVGPRPPTPDEVEKYEFHQLRRLSVRQGLTGLWQVSGRDAVRNFDERLALDLYYIDHWSLTMDLRILLKTIFIIFKGAS